MPELHDLSNRNFALCPVQPRFFAHPFVGRGVQSHEWRPHTRLDPPGSALVISEAAKMPADVVTPPAEADVRGRRGELGLKVEAGPGVDGVAREADGVAVRPRPRVAREGDRPLTNAPAGGSAGVPPFTGIP